MFSSSTSPLHIVMVLMDDIGWNNVDWHRAAANATTDPPLTPHMSSLVRNGIELTSHYAYQMCAPSRSAFQSGRSPLHVTLRNDDVVIPDAGVSPNMTGLGTLMKRAGYATHFYGKVILRCGCVLLDRRRDLCSSLPLLFSPLLSSPLLLILSRCRSGTQGWRRTRTRRTVAGTTSRSSTFTTASTTGRRHRPLAAQTEEVPPPPSL